MKVLVTGFEPFGGDDENASGTAVQALRGRPDVVTAILPVEFGKAGDLLVSLSEEHRPDVVVCVGEAGGRTAVSVERFAYNLAEARIPDNAGWQPHGVAVIDGLDDILETELDADALADAVRGCGVAAEVSEDPGRYVCNELYFHALARLDVPAVFVHAPAVRASGVASVGAETDQDAQEGELPSADDLARALAGVVDALRPPVRSGPPA